MCVKQRSVAQISEEVAEELGVTFKDNNNNYIVGLQLAAELEVEDFIIVSADYSESKSNGILPLNPRKPIVRPKPSV